MNNKIKHLYEFENFRVDLFQKCLWQDENLVSLTPKAFDTLVVLIRNKGNLVEKDTLLNEVWANTFVEESTLAQNISTLRKTLALQPNGKQFIETIPKRGYRFVGNVREVVDDEFYVVETHTRTQIIAEQEVILDSDPADSRTNWNLQNSAALKATPAPHLKNKVLIAAAAFIVMVLVVGIVVGNRYFNRSKPQFEEKFRQFQMSKITSNGNVSKIAISPDGKYVALVEKKDESQTLSLRQTNNANSIEIVPPTKNEFIGLTFSADSEFIYYSIYQDFQDNPAIKIGVLYKIPILGGTRTEVLKDIDSPVAISPDGKKLAFIRNSSNQRESALMLFDCQGAGEIKLTARKLRERFTPAGISWSPDGKNIAAVALNAEDAASRIGIVITKVETGEQASFTENTWSWIGQISWLNDGSGMVFSAFDAASPNMTDEIWFASYPEGKSRQIGSGINGFFGLGISADGNSIVTVRSDRVTSLWIAPKDRSTEPLMINKSIGDNSLTALGLNWTPDGKILYASNQTGNSDIWIVNSDGSNPKQLTNDKNADLAPLPSPDGRFIIFISNRTKRPNIWRMNSDGSDQKKLSDFNYSFSPSMAADGKWVYFGARNAMFAPPFLWKIAIEGGEPVQVTNLYTGVPKISPDGKYIACYYPDISDLSRQPGNLKLSFLSAADGTIIKQIDLPKKGEETAFMWTPDSRAISYLITKNNISTIWLQSIDGTPPQKVFGSESDQIFQYSWSFDSKNIVFEKGITVNDIVLIRNAANSN